jgi:DtxR family Mn-dependent transcriptional regulator
MLSEAAEEILEILWIVRERTGADHMKINEIFKTPDPKLMHELTGTQIIEVIDQDELKITPKGIKFAAEAIRRHRLAERLLVDVLCVKSELIHETACQFEHHLHKGIDVNICTLLGHPKVCPHGRPIPPGPCCEEGAKTIGQAVASLAQLKPGQGGHVAYLHTVDPKQAQMLISMGVSPGREIKLLARFPSFIFGLGESQFAVDTNVAREIYVRLDNRDKT